MHRRVLRCSLFAATLLGTACGNQSAKVGGPLTGSVLAHFDGTLPVGAVLAGAIKYGPKDAMIPSYSITFHKSG